MQPGATVPTCERSQGDKGMVRGHLTSEEDSSGDTWRVGSLEKHGGWAHWRSMRVGSLEKHEGVHIRAMKIVCANILF